MRTKWIVWFGALLLLTWAVLVTLSPNAQHTTALGGVADAIHPRWLLATVLWAVSLSTLSALLVGDGGARGRFPEVHKRIQTWRLGTLAAQQALLFLAAYASLSAVAHGQYGDGVERPQAFMLADQIPASLGFLLHTLAVLEIGGITWIQPSSALRRWRFRA